MKGERVNKYWTRVNNPKTPRNLIHRLTHPVTHEMMTRSDKMSELTRDYHDNLQKEGLLQPTIEPRLSAIQEALGAIPETQKLNDPHLSPLSSELTYVALESALQLLKLGSAAGPDGLPYELWRHLHCKHQLDTKAQTPSFDVINCLRTVLNDIQEHGVDIQTQFTLGWMCPI